MDTLGGEKLRRLRAARALTQEEVALENVIATRTLSNIESGKTQYPKRETIEGLLAFYEASFDEAQDVLKSYGFRPEYTLPSAKDIAVILEQIQPTLNAAPVPAYCVDYIARFHAFNELLLRLSGWDHAKMESLKGEPLWKARIENRIAAGEDAQDPRLLNDVGRKRQQLNRLYTNEPWFEAFIEGCGEPFLTSWRAAAKNVREQSPSMSLSASALRPVLFKVPDIPQPLGFFFHEEALSDPRFRILYLLPASAEAGDWITAQRAE